MNMLGKSAKTLIFLISPLILLAVNELLIYKLYIGRCNWPNTNGTSANLTKVMLIADTHLLGVFRGHWFDKLLRDWQMNRAFRTAMEFFPPEAIFFLGDLFDEGLLGPDHLFEEYVRRFNGLFETVNYTKKFYVAGNHDIGFHHEIFAQRFIRFANHFSEPGVEVVRLKGNDFVLINSMALEGDDCVLCSSAREEILRLSKHFDCSTKSSSKKKECPRPILMQHFPLFRKNDGVCEDDWLLPTAGLRGHLFREKLDTISEESTRFMLDSLKPKAAFGGHTHHGCKRWWPDPWNFYEYSIPSFSWRNTRVPAFLLLQVSPEDLFVDYCTLPDEYFVIALYSLFSAIWLFVLYRNCSIHVFKCLKFMKNLLLHIPRFFVNYFFVKNFKRRNKENNE